MDDQSGNDKLEPKKEDGTNRSQLNSVDILRGEGKTGDNKAGGGNKTGESKAGEPDKVRLPASTDKSAQEPPIGVAQLKENETIVLHLKGKEGDLSGEAEVEFKLGDKLYDDVFKHLGGIKKGETKLVPAWQDASENKQGQPRKQSITDGNKTPEQGDQSPGKAPDTTTGTTTDKTTDKSTDSKNDATTPGAQPGDIATPEIIVPPSVQFVTKVNDTYAKMSPEVRDILSHEGAVVTPTRRITDALPELKGQKPRGWPPGLTWDAVDGAYSPSRNLVVVAEETRDTNNKWNKSNRTEDVTRHEVGHATDYAMGKFSNSAAFTQAYEADTQVMPAALTGTLKYFLQSGDGGKEEACAEGIAAREGGSTSGKVFESGFAKSIAAINDALLLLRAKLPKAPGAGSPDPITPVKTGN